MASTPSVAIITSNFWPEQSGIGQVTTEFAKFLTGKGIEVRVATAMPYYPEWRIHERYRGMSAVKEDVDGITVYRAWHYATPAPGAVSRIVHEGSLCLFAVPQIIRALDGADAAYIVSPDLSLAFVGSRIARLMKVRQSVVIQDVQPEAAVDLGMLRNRRVIALAKSMARSLYAAATEIVTLSEGMKRRIESHPQGHGKVTVMPNTVDKTELDLGADQGEQFRTAFVPSGTFAVVHAGNMGQKQDLDIILRTAACLVLHGKVHFYVFGDGAVKDDFLRKKNDAGLTSVSHYPFQPREMLPHMLRGADAVLVTQLPEVVDVVLPLKLITAMGAGAMIVAACAESSETHRILLESGGGIVVPPSDAAALAAVLAKLERGEIETEGYRRAAREYCFNHFDREAVYGPLAEALRGTAPRHRQRIVDRLQP